MSGIVVDVIGMEATTYIGDVFVLAVHVPNQTPNYSDITPSDAANWNNVEPIDSSGWADVTPTQDPEYEEVDTG